MAKSDIAHATLMSRHKWTYKFVLTNTAQGLLVAFISPARRIELWPIDLEEFEQRQAICSRMKTHVEHAMCVDEMQTPTANDYP